MLRDGNDIYLDKRMRVAEKHAIVEGVGETSLSSNRLGDDMHNLPYGLSSDHVSSRYRTQDMALSGVPAVDGAVPVEDTTQQTGILENKQYPDSSNPRPQQLEEMQIGIEQQPPPVQSEAVQGSVPFAKGHVGDHWWQLYHGDCRTILPDLPKQSVHCVVTSPPYYWQRDYGVDGQVGLEPTIDGYVQNIVATFQGLKSILQKDGTIFLNLGDTYYSAKGLPHGDDSKHRARRFGLRAVDGPGLGLPRKSLIGIPWRVALALSADGWTLRSAVAWVRESSIPEPTAKDRPWRKYEFVFIFCRSTRYYFNREGLNGEEDVWTIEPDRNSLARGTHYAPYPRALVERCIQVGCPDGGVVLDPFVGGGTTMSVALAMQRPTIGIELNEEFCKIVRDKLRAQ